MAASLVDSVDPVIAVIAVIAVSKNISKSPVSTLTEWMLQARRVRR